MSEPCWLATSKNMATVVLGPKPHIFHLVVFPMPISVSATFGPFSLADTHGPSAPATKMKSKNADKERTLYKHFVYKINPRNNENF